jgi:DNA-directed RNA polymerase specialized sigma24 family protein
LAALLALPAFERFVFAMTVLESYSVHEAATLLNCDPREVKQARVSALRGIAAEQKPLLPYSVAINSELPAAVSVA